MARVAESQCHAHHRSGLLGKHPERNLSNSYLQLCSMCVHSAIFYSLCKNLFIFSEQRPANAHTHWLTFRLIFKNEKSDLSREWSADDRGISHEKKTVTAKHFSRLFGGFSGGVNKTLAVIPGFIFTFQTADVCTRRRFNEAFNRLHETNKKVKEIDTWEISHGDVEIRVETANFSMPLKCTSLNRVYCCGIQSINRRNLHDKGARIMLEMLSDCLLRHLLNGAT